MIGQVVVVPAIFCFLSAAVELLVALVVVVLKDSMGIIRQGKVPALIRVLMARGLLWTRREEVIHRKAATIGSVILQVGKEEGASLA